MIPLAADATVGKLALITMTTSEPSTITVKVSAEFVVDLPTPPFPERTRIVCLTEAILAATSANAGSTLRPSPDAHLA